MQVGHLATVPDGDLCESSDRVSRLVATPLTLSLTHVVVLSAVHQSPSKPHSVDRQHVLVVTRQARQKQTDESWIGVMRGCPLREGDVGLDFDVGGGGQGGLEAVGVVKEEVS